MSDKVVIGHDRLMVVLAYLADKAPDGLAQRRERARCVSILSAQRKEAPGATKATETHTHTCWTCTLRMGCAATSNAGCGGYTTDAAKMTSPDDAAGKCGGCILRGNCDEDTLPGGCPKYVGKQTATPPPQYAPATVAFPAYVTRDELAKGLLESRWHQANRLQDQIDEAMKAHLGEKHGITITDISCRTCHHHAVCGKMNNTGCESWEGEHPR
jgi:hypothetical protein